MRDKGVWWRRFDGSLIPSVAALWVMATYTGWVYSIAFLSHVSMAAFLLAAISAWRADKPTPPE